MKKDKKQKQRLSKQLNKPKREKEELKKLKLSKREEKARNLVSEWAYFAWRDKLQHRDFIGERDFSRLISPFEEIIEKRGWHLFCENKAPGFVDFVKEFYTNMVGMKEIVQQGDYRPNFQSEQEKEWFELQKTSKRTRFPEDC